MAHGFLGYTPVSGESPLLGLLGRGFEKLLESKIWPLRKQQDAIAVRVSEIRDALKPGQPKSLPAATNMLSGKSPAMLGAGASAIAKQEPLALPGGVDGGIATRKPGGAFTDIPGVSAASSGLNPETFFKQAQTGVGASGEYLTKAQRIADFRQSQEMRSASAGPAISPDSGIDIVAAVNKNTQAIVSLVDVTKDQTKNDTNLSNQQIQIQQRMLSRQASAAEENALEQGSDLSGFMTPENFEKRKENEKKKKDNDKGSKLKEFFKGPNVFKKEQGCGCSPILGGPPGGGGGLSIPDYVDEYRDMNRRGRPSNRPASRLGGGASVMRRGGGAKGLTRLATKVGGKGAGKAVAKGLGKGLLKKIPGVGAVAGAAFAAERAMKGDWLGAGGELLSGIAGIVPGIGTGISTAIDAGLMARDAGLTPFARGGIITRPTAGLVGEAGNEGVFPLEGKQGEKTFKMFGEGIFQAQKDNDKDFAKLQSMGLKQYYEREGGFKKMGEGLKDFFSSLAGGIASLFGGPANAATGPGGGGGGDFSGNNNQDIAMNYFMSQGMSKAQAAGIVGNLMQESTAALDPNANNGMGHRGIAQWDRGRWAKLEKFAKDKGTSATDFQTQLEFIMKELKDKGADGGATTLADIMASKDEKQSARAFLKGFERSGEERGQAGYEARMTNATGLVKRGISGGGPGQGGGSSSALAGAAARLKGMTTKDGPDGGENGCVWAVNKVYKAAGITPPWGSSVYVPDAEKKMVGSGYQQVGYGQRQPGDVMVMYDRESPPQAHIGVVLPNGNVLSNSSKNAKFSWEDSPEGYNRYYGSQGKIYRMPGGSSASTIAKNKGNQSPGAAPAQPLSTNGNPNAMASIFQRPAGNLSTPAATPSPLFNMSAANPNTGTPMMATSQQVAMASMGGGAAPTVINNYYTSAGGGGGGVNPNGVSSGIDFDAAGLSAFTQLKLRSLG